MPSNGRWDLIRRLKVKWTRPFRRKTKFGFCACAITFQTQSTINCSAVGRGVSLGRVACRRVFNSEAEVVSAQELRSSVSGRRPAVVQCDVSRKVDWLWRASVFNANVFSCGDNRRNTFTQSLSGLPNISGLCQMQQRLMTQC
jgi:hypothetical protein